MHQLALFIIYFSLLFCSGFASPSTLPEPDSRAIDSLTRFAFSLYRASAPNTGNYSLSPPSLYSTLAIPYWGGHSELQTQFQNTLHFPSSEPQFLNILDFLHALSAPDLQPDSSPSLQIQTSIWTAPTLSLSSSFLSFLQRSFSISPFLVDFKHHNPSVHQQINRYVSEKTYGQIPQLLAPDTLPLETQLFLLNTLYFKADWASPFLSEATYKSVFYTNTTLTTTVNMMVQETDLLYYETPEYQAVQCDYDSDTFSMLFVLPKADLGPLFKEISPDFISSFQDHAKIAPCVLQLPRFKTHSRLSLKTALKALGLSALFRSDIVYPQITAQALPLFDVFHQVVLEVDESGTTAAAASGGIMSSTSFNPNKKFMIMNKPFLYFLIHRPSQTILVMGQIDRP